MNSQAKTAYVTLYGTWDEDHFDVAYEGEFASNEAFTDHHVECMGFFEGASETVRLYFDWDQYANDLMSGYAVVNGHYFNKNA
jgi:antirestriction protein